MTDATDGAETAFLTALAELRDGYCDQPFWTERDIVYWLQRRLTALTPDRLRIYNDYGMIRGPRRARSADLAVVADGGVRLAVEFKYEPAAGRPDIMANKLPVIDWVDLGTDIPRIEEFVLAQVTPVAWSVCIDEGGRYRSRPRHQDSRVEEWPTGYDTQVTVTRFPAVRPSGTVTP